MRKTNPLILLGAAIIALGAVFVAFAARGDDDKAASEISVLTASDDIAAGATGDSLIQSGGFHRVAVASDKRPPDALTDPSQLSGRVFDVSVTKGSQLRASQLRPRTARGNAIDIPDGKQGVAVDLSFVNAGAGYVGAGDRINLYGNVAGLTKLLLSNIEVLDVSTEVAPRRGTTPATVPGSSQAGTRAGGSAVTFLLALDPIEAERVIFLAANAEMWVALADTDAAPVGPTPGRRLADVFQP